MLLFPFGERQPTANTAMTQVMPSFHVGISPYFYRQRSLKELRLSSGESRKKTRAGVSFFAYTISTLEL
jgi:hypothetical protein